MKKADEMIEYVKSNKYGVVLLRNASFKTVENNLSSGEDVIFCFTGSIKDSSSGGWVFAITNRKRLIYCDKVILSSPIVNIIQMESIKRIVLNQTNLEIDTLTNKLIVGLSGNFQAIFKKISDILVDFKAEKNKSQTQSPKVATTTSAVNPTVAAAQNQKSLNDLIILKKLLDEGIITQEEFNAKKKQILGL